MQNKTLEYTSNLCYYVSMRQKFDVGDLVRMKQSENQGIIIETEPINRNIKYPEAALWHTDEYKCKVQFIATSETKWIRAKWLEHLSKIS